MHRPPCFSRSEFDYSGGHALPMPSRSLSVALCDLSHGFDPWMVKLYKVMKRKIVLSGSV